MIQLQDVRYAIGERVLFDGVDWVIGPGDRCALVGPNGAGKTTLIRLILGEATPESGTCVRPRGTRIGYLPQEAAERYDGTVLDRAMEAHRALLDMRTELDALHEELSSIGADDPRLESMLERAGDLQHHLEHHDEHTLEPEARRVLSGLGFSTTDQDRPLAEFSGGWRMRAALAALLLADPTVLFMDEPTNHLDLPAMEWLEDYLEDFAGGLVVVSHDRVFLDRVANEVRELEHGKLTPYSMRFSLYIEEKALRREQAAASNAQLDAKIAQLQRFVERFGAKNTKAAQAQSKRKQIDRLKAQHQVIPRLARSIRFSFPDPPHAGRTLIRLRDLSFGYEGGPDVIAHARVEIEKGEKLAIVGANGAGKTTLLRVLAGQLEPRLGERELPPLTKMSYFAQHAAETLDGRLTVLQSLEDVASDEWRPRLRSLLGTFLFSGDDVFKPCRVLSGGERQRVALARLLLTPSNLLLMDEPTHHLDLAGKDVLEDALAQYPGGVIVVTHDRSLMARVATRVLEVNGGRVALYPGGYDDYESTRLNRVAEESERQRARSRPPAGNAQKAGSPPKAGGSGNPAPSPAPAATAGRGASPAATQPHPDRTTQNASRKRQREIARLETEIAERETRQRHLEEQLADPELYHDAARSQGIVVEYERVRSELESLWQRLAELG
ncbi:MAG TPA: ABC-F family ATP-binding cassette domain-containing protein [Methylomirabilota bacterium]|jgi:ATP-binding cassette subfamily F protein 3|nr:ABC-F family ATP-binding cassette domain-containing protein [Methylomirabilota bacterium]